MSCIAYCDAEFKSESFTLLAAADSHSPQNIHKFDGGAGRFGFGIERMSGGPIQSVVGTIQANLMVDQLLNDLFMKFDCIVSLNIIHPPKK